MKRITKYFVALVPLALAALYAGLTMTSEPQVMGMNGGVFDNVYSGWILIGFVITVLVLLADAASDIRNTWHHRHH